MTSIDDLLSGGGAAGKSLKFEHVGQQYGGTVVSAEIRPYTDLKTGKPEFWDDNPAQPKRQIVIGIQTDLRDPSIEDDDGVRYDYVKAWGVQKKGLQAASKTAGGSPAPGDFYGVKFVGEEPSKTRGFNPTKLYEYTVRKANPLDATLATPATPAAAPAAPAAPAGEQFPAALTDSQKSLVAQLIGVGQTDAQIAAVISAPEALVTGARLQLVAAGSGGGF